MQSHGENKQTNQTSYGKVLLRAWQITTECNRGSTNDLATKWQRKTSRLDKFDMWIICVSKWYNHIMKLFVRLSCGKVQKPASPLKSELPWNQTDQNKKNQKRKTSLVLRLHETTDNDCPNIPTKNQNVSWNLQKCLEIATDPGKKENKCVLFNGWMILGSFFFPKIPI